jgi:hypothetical protein
MDSNFKWDVVMVVVAVAVAVVVAVVVVVAVAVVVAVMVTVMDAVEQYNSCIYMIQYITYVARIST